MKIMQELVTFVTETTYASIPSEVIEKAKAGVIDFLGCTLLGTTNKAGEIMLQYVKSLAAKPEATVIGGGFKTSTALAALANGTLSHADDFDDISFSIPGHPSVTVLPAVLSVGELQQSSGADCLAAYLIGFEVTCKLGQALAPKLYQNGWHATSVLGCLGATAAAGKLLGLTEGQVTYALGIAGSLASGLRQNLGTMTKPIHVGMACQNGVTAAFLAQRGITANLEALDGELGFCQNFSGSITPGKIVGRLGNPYDVVAPGIIYKQYPSCAETHPALDATISLAREHDIRPEEIDSVHCVVTPLDYDVLVYDSPRTALEGKFSLHFCAALGLLKKRALLQDFDDQVVADPGIIALMRKVSMESSPYLSEDGYNGAATIVTVTMENGKQYSRRVDHAKGSPAHPLSTEELLAKYRDCAKAALHSEGLEKSIECLLTLEATNPVNKLLNVLSGSDVSSR